MRAPAPAPDRKGRSRPFRRVLLEALRVDDEPAMRHVELYPRLKEVLVRDRYSFRVPAARSAHRDWNRALLLNLGFWSPSDPADVLVEARIPADVVAHVAWHHLAGRALGDEARSGDGLLLAESIASAFDLFLVGRLLRHAPRSSFLQTQVPRMAEVAESAGAGKRHFESLMTSIAEDPEAAFVDLRALLFDVSTRLLRARGPDEAARTLDSFERHRFHVLLHHYNVANWILYSRAYAAPPAVKVGGREVSRVDRALRRGGLDWLERNWL